MSTSPVCQDEPMLQVFGGRQMWMVRYREVPGGFTEIRGFIEPVEALLHVAHLTRGNFAHVSPACEDLVTHHDATTPTASAAGDSVDHPQHYTSHPSGVECIEITEHMSFTLGNALKYIWRADLKGDAVEDLRKARWYLDREITRREAAATDEARS